MLARIEMSVNLSEPGAKMTMTRKQDHKIKVIKIRNLTEAFTEKFGARTK